MPVISIRRIAILLLVALAACSPEPRVNPYEAPASTPRVDGAVLQLQREAVAAFNRGAFQQAVDRLQRAIRIEPRNPLSWHYLAQTYWRSGDFARCVDMAQRSQSYAADDARLDSINARLLERCREASG